MNNELNLLSDKTLEKLIPRKATDLFIRIGLIGFLVVCVKWLSIISSLSIGFAS